jgi:hypothetical protein
MLPFVGENVQGKDIIGWKFAEIGRHLVRYHLVLLGDRPVEDATNRAQLAGFDDLPRPQVAVT